MSRYRDDSRVVMTLDAGGTSFRFGALRGLEAAVETFTLPSEGDALEPCLRNLQRGFAEVRAQCPTAPVAISFAFPGPADYPAGIIIDPPNMPAMRGGVAIGPMLEDAFGIPVFINNDGHLFAYGEALAGLLPHVNALLAEAGRPKRYATLLGVTLGTGFGGGLAVNGRLYAGDHGLSGEVRFLRNPRDERTWAEEGASLRAVKREYAELTGTSLEAAPDPKEIFEIATGVRPGDASAALQAYRRLGQVVGDALAQASALVDGLVVVGGGLSGAWPLFLPALIEEMNGHYDTPRGPVRRLTPVAFSLEDPEDRRRFVTGGVRETRVPGSDRVVHFEGRPSVGVGLSRLGTSQAIAVGAYAFALEKLDGRP